MAYLNENNAFANQNNLGWVFTFQPNGKYPVIDNRIFANKEAAQAYLDDPTSSAIPGLILRVIEDSSIENNGAYLVEKISDSSLKLTLLSSNMVVWENDIEEINTDVEQQSNNVESE